MNVTETLTGIELLETKFKKKVQAWLAHLMRERIYVAVIETYRTPMRQKYLYDRGKSQTLDSKHIKGLAIDVVPVSEYKYKRVQRVTWDVKDPVWKRIASIANLYGIAWGGDWSTFSDYVHFEEPTHGN